MLAKIYSAAVYGVDAYEVEIEVNGAGGDPNIVIVGLPDAAVKESRDRVTTAIANSGYYWPRGRTTINLAPADIKKEGPSFDLPIALGMIAVTEGLDSSPFENFSFVGELALDGTVRAVKGVLPVALEARRRGKRALFVPEANALEAATSFVSTRPFRDRHHTISDIGLPGGGTFPNPGEVSLAHNGVLFLDELPEFKRSALEVMRQPIEDGKVTVSRAAGSVTFPSEFMLVAAMNPCPCGYFGDLKRECRCGPAQVQRYRQRISGPLLDRIDLHIEVPAVEYRDVASERAEETSAMIRERVIRARQRQQERFRGDGKVNCNARMATRHLKQHCKLSQDSQELIRVAMSELNLSARAYDRILKVSRTIADLDGKTEISPEHVSEAIQYRTFDRTLFAIITITAALPLINNVHALIEFVRAITSH